jgi:hypothetical protein
MMVSALWSALGLKPVNRSISMLTGALGKALRTPRERG